MVVLPGSFEEFPDIQSKPQRIYPIDAYEEQHVTADTAAPAHPPYHAALSQIHDHVQQMSQHRQHVPFLKQLHLHGYPVSLFIGGTEVHAVTTYVHAGIGFWGEPMIVPVHAAIKLISARQEILQTSIQPMVSQIV